MIFLIRKYDLKLQLTIEGYLNIYLHPSLRQPCHQGEGKSLCIFFVKMDTNLFKHEEFKHHMCVMT